MTTLPKIRVHKRGSAWFVVWDHTHVSLETNWSNALQRAVRVADEERYLSERTVSS